MGEGGRGQRVSPAARGGSAAGCRPRTRLTPPRCSAGWGRVQVVLRVRGGVCVLGLSLGFCYGLGGRESTTLKITRGSERQELPEGTPRGVGGAGDTRRVSSCVSPCAWGCAGLRLAGTPGEEELHHARQVRGKSPPAPPAEVEAFPPPPAGAVPLTPAERGT
ncbi:hypothetical protein AV530_012580 [Patagioenas fasciata monilis]|uniref:Uncharacterized protein n=1 Tax=Patagioenas fasciata monilis TaxID=372326 RepID=A0A1V4JBT4_PATFA|nr:hypothetical protein AV530_012580 [Patagioenas fasciata monilis]